MNPAIETEGLTRSFDRRERSGRIRRKKVTHDAVAGLSLSVAAGEIVGYIGPNGAGKSTTIKMLTGILAPTSGAVRVVGLVPVRDRVRLARRIGVVFGQRSNLWWDLPLADSFDLLRHIYRVPAVAHAATLAWLTGLLDRFPTKIVGVAAFLLPIASIGILMFAGSSIWLTKVSDPAGAWSPASAASKAWPTYMPPCNAACSM